MLLSVPAIFTSSTQLFSWADTGATAYQIHVGTIGAGSSNLAALPNPPSTATSASVSSLPTDGSIVYVRLNSLISGVWQYTDYQFTAYTAPLKATMLPSVPATITGGSQNFSWTATGASLYQLHIGTTSAGSTDIGYFPNPSSLATSVNVTGLPTAGTVYVRLYSRIDEVWQYNDYQYTAVAAQVDATMLLFIRYNKNAGNNAIYAHLRNGGGYFWDFLILAWVLFETAACKAFFTECPDSDTDDSLFLCSPMLPANGPWVVQCFTADGKNIGYDTTAIDTTVSSRLATTGYTAPDNAGITAIKGGIDNVQTGVNLLLDGVGTLLDIGEGNWEVINNQMIFYSRAGDEFMRFDLKTKNNVPTEGNASKRVAV